MSHHNNSSLNLVRQHGLDWATFNFNYHHPCESTDAASRMLSGAILACYEDAIGCMDYQTSKWLSISLNCPTEEVLMNETRTERFYIEIGKNKIEGVETANQMSIGAFVLVAGSLRQDNKSCASLSVAGLKK
jgi:hypothetical protein